MNNATIISVFDFTNFFVGVISFILGILALYLSLYFYEKTKESEVRVSNMLEAIKTQTEMLQKITTRQLDKFVKNATDQKPFDELFLTIFSAVKSVPDSNLQLQLKDQEIQTLSNEAIRGYIGAYYYSAVANVILQIELPSPENYDPSNSGQSLIKNLIDESYKDCLWLKGVLAGVDQQVILSHPVGNYYELASTNWEQYVKDSAAVFADKSQPTG